MVATSMRFIVHLDRSFWVSIVGSIRKHLEDGGVILYGTMLSVGKMQIMSVGLMMRQRRTRPYTQAIRSQPQRVCSPRKKDLEHEAKPADRDVGKLLYARNYVIPTEETSAFFALL